MEANVIDELNKSMDALQKTKGINPQGQPST